MDKQIEMALQNQEAMRELDSYYTKQGAYDLTMIRHPDQLGMGKSDQPDEIDTSCRRAIVEKWGAEAVSILDQLLELRASARAACPMPLDIAIEVWKKHTVLTERMVKIAEPFVKGLEQENKEMLRGIKANLLKGVVGNPDVLMECADMMVRHLPSIVEQRSGLDQMRSLYMKYQHGKDSLQNFINRKAETLEPKPDLAKWAKS